MDLTGRTLGNYQIDEELGRGTMATVYRAYQPSLNRYVAVKVLLPHLGRDQQFVERFQREVRAAASLHHPNIVVIHDVGQDDGTHYIVMEYLRGRTLKELVEQTGPLPPQRAAYIVEQIAAALDYAHQRGLVHGAVNPANVFVAEGDRVTLTDFGMAAAASETEPPGRSSMPMGTPEYASPEQAKGEHIDYRTDLYALGVVLYQLLVGQVPFHGATPLAVLHDIIYEAPVPPRQVNPSLSPALEAVLLKAIDKQADNRYQHGSALVKDLRRALSGAGMVGAGPPVPPPPQWAGIPASRPPRRGMPVAWILAGIAGVLVLLIAGALVILATMGDRDATPSPSPSQVIALGTETPAGGEVTPSLAPATSDEPTATSTATPPATPTEEPTATSESATDTPLAPTDTPSPTPTHTPTSTTPPPPITCSFDAQGTFASLWNTYKEQLGCPAYAEPKAIQDAEQAFENGRMFWRQDNERIYVVYEQGSRSGTYQDFADLWSEGDPEYSCSATPPPGLVQPIRGFGAIWCDLGAASAPIGWGLSDEAGFWAGNGDPLVQDFEHGVIFRDSDGTIQGLAYVLFGDTGEFERVAY